MLLDPTLLLVGKTADARPVDIHVPMANRHGLIAGATGTGKSVTLQNLAQGFSLRGIPVFTADVKGDLAGLSQAGVPNERVDARIKQLGMTDEFIFAACPTVLYDLYGKRGHPIRTTVSEMGPLMLGRLLDLNDVQQGVLELTFRVADDNGLLVLDMKDLRSLLTAVAENASELTTTYGNVSKTSVGALQRKLASLQDAGGDVFFGEPGIEIDDLLRVDAKGRGVVSILDATKLLADARLYSTFLLWLLSELFTKLDEVGDAKKPRLVFFFDEAHLLFTDAPKSLVDKIEQVIRLIRSKGVGVYFATQSPLDIPETVLGQLGHRVQHALRAFTPRDQAAVRTAAQTFRQNPALNTEEVITELAVGEALVSVMDSEGRPTPVERTLCAPPSSRIGAITDVERTTVVESSVVYGKYEDSVDRESAFELLQKRKGSLKTDGVKSETAPTATDSTPVAPTPPSESGGGIMSTVGGVLSGIFSSTGRRQSLGETFTKSVMRSVGSKVGNEIVRGVLGSIFGGKR